MYLKKIMIMTLMLMILTSASHADEMTSPEAVSAEVSQAVLAFNQAYEVNDLNKYFSYYEDGATMWFNQDFVAISDYKKDWYQLVESGGGVEKNVLSDLKIKVNPDGNAAVAAYRLEVHTRMPDGKITRDLSQESDTWFKYEGQWRIAHLHYVTQPVSE